MTSVSAISETPAYYVQMSALIWLRAARPIGQPAMEFWRSTLKNRHAGSNYVGRSPIIAPPQLSICLLVAFLHVCSLINHRSSSASKLALLARDSRSCVDGL